MKKIILTFLIMFLATPALATNFCPDTQGATSVQKRIFWDELSTRSGCLLVPNSMNAFLSSIPRKYLKVDGSTIREMTNTEKATIDQADQVNRNARVRQLIIDRVNNDPLMRVILEIDFTKENQLRALHSMPPITRANYLQRIVDEAMVIFP